MHVKIERLAQVVFSEPNVNKFDGLEVGDFILFLFKFVGIQYFSLLALGASDIHFFKGEEVTITVENSEVLIGKEIEPRGCRHCLGIAHITSY